MAIISTRGTEHFEYILNHKSFLVMKLGQLIDIVTGSIFRNNGGLGPKSGPFLIY